MDFLFLKIWALYAVFAGAIIFIDSRRITQILDKMIVSSKLSILVGLLYFIFSIAIGYEMYSDFRSLHLVALIDVFSAFYIFCFSKDLLKITRIQLENQNIWIYGMFISLIGALVLYIL